MFASLAPWLTVPSFPLNAARPSESARLHLHVLIANQETCFCLNEQSERPSLESLSCLVDLIGRLRPNDPIRRAILFHIVEGRLKLSSLPQATKALRARQDSRRLSPSLIAVLGYKLSRMPNGHIAKLLGLSKKRVQNLVYEIYQALLGEEEWGLSPEEKQIRLRQIAQEQGLI